MQSRGDENKLLIVARAVSFASTIWHVHGFACSSSGSMIRVVLNPHAARELRVVRELRVASVRNTDGKGILSIKVTRDSKRCFEVQASI